MEEPLPHKVEVVKIEDANNKSSNDKNIHPLSNPEVLTQMFKLCPVDLLAKFRLVSKQWHDVSLQSWRGSVTITFRSDNLTESDPDFFWEINSCFSPPFQKHKFPTDHLPSTTVQMFLNYVQIPDNDHSLKPFRKFQLDEWEFKKLDDQIDQFKNICGPFITVLELSDCYFHYLNIFRNVMFSWFPNLKRLIIKNIQCRWYVTPPVEPEKYDDPRLGEHKNLKYLKIDLNHEQLPICWMELFSHYPKLTSFKICNADYGEYIEKMLNAIKIIRKHDPRKLQITNLDLLATGHYPQDMITPETCHLIHTMELPLESLTIDIGVKTDSKKVQDILVWHATTMKTLVISRGRDSIPYQNFPFGVQLDNLQEIVISDRISDSLAFMKLTPNLKKLGVYDVAAEEPLIISTQIVQNTDLQIMRDTRLEKCTELTFCYNISVKDTNFLMKLLPNIEKGKMPMNTDQFRLACELWSNLRDLEVLGNELDDDAITGLSSEDVKTINKMTEKDDKILIAVSPVAIHPNITNLIHLRRFKMNNDDVAPTKLMDCSAFHGFLKLSHLQTLYISSQMGDHARNALLEKIADCTVIRSEMYSVSDWN